jgi:hypothetical protein
MIITVSIIEKVKRALNTLDYLIDTRFKTIEKEVAEFQADEDDKVGLLQAQRDLELNEGDELTTLISRIDIYDSEVRKISVKFKRFLKPFIVTPHT